MYNRLVKHFVSNVLTDSINRLRKVADNHLRFALVPCAIVNVRFRQTVNFCSLNGLSRRIKHHTELSLYVNAADNARYVITAFLDLHHRVIDSGIQRRTACLWNVCARLCNGRKLLGRFSCRLLPQGAGVSHPKYQCSRRQAHSLLSGQ